jgi:short-subunit dehydrogenase
LLRRAHADVVFVNSTAALHGVPNVAEYAMSKAAIRAFADSLRAEENAQGLRVLSVYVGRTATPMQEQVAREEGRDYHPERLLQPEDVASAILAALMLPHTAEITDIHIRPNMPPA